MECGDTNKEASNSDICGRKLDQLESLLALAGDSDFESFSLMAEISQRAIFTLAYDLSREARKIFQKEMAAIKNN